MERRTFLASTLAASALAVTAPGSALALTTVSYDWHTGEIYDADVEVNGTSGKITNFGKPGIFSSVRPAPDSKHFLVSRVHKPYSYQLPATAFSKAFYS